MVGTFNSEDIAVGIKAGSLVPSDHYWHEGMTDWLPVAQLLTTQRDARFTRIRNIASSIIVIIALIGVIALRSTETEKRLRQKELPPKTPKKQW